jgi:hypothetical protein
MGFSLAKVLSECSRRFHEIGTQDKDTTPAPGGANRDSYFHEYAVAKHLEGAAKKRAEGALSALLEHSSDVNTSESGMHTLEHSGPYLLTIEIKRGRTMVDPTALVNALAKAGVPKDKIDAAVEAATKTAKASRSYRVMQNG